MNVRIVFGQLLLSAGKKLTLFANRLGVTDTGPGSTTEKVLVWGVVEGPFSRDDFPEEELEDMGFPDDWNWMVIANVQEGDKLGTMNLWFPTFDEAYKLCSYFKTSIEPLELEG